MSSWKGKVKSRLCPWETLPPEIMYEIFSYLDEISLLNCMGVNKRWYCMISTIARVSGWRNMIVHGFPDMGANFIKKSMLNWREMAVNNCLWRNVKNAEPVFSHSYELENIRNVNVYKGDIIVTCPPKVIYYDPETFSVKKTIDYACSNFDENDYLFAATSLDTFDLTLCHKPDPNSEWRADGTETFSVNLYKMIYKGCYIVAPDNSLSFITWEDEAWNVKFVARFYGHGRISDVILYHNTVYVLMDWGKILKLNKDELQFIPGFGFTIPKARVTMYQISGAIIEGSDTKTMQFLRQGPNHWIFKIPNMASVLIHGDMLLLGYKNGKVQIYLPHNMKSGKPRAELTFKVQDFFETPVKDPTILALDVSESSGSQEIYVVTSNNLLQLKLKYPQGMRDFMLENVLIKN